MILLTILIAIKIVQIIIIMIIKDIIIVQKVVQLDIINILKKKRDV